MYSLVAEWASCPYILTRTLHIFPTALAGIGGRGDYVGFGFSEAGGSGRWLIELVETRRRNEWYRSRRLRCWPSCCYWQLQGGWVDERDSRQLRAAWGKLAR